MPAGRSLHLAPFPTLQHMRFRQFGQRRPPRSRVMYRAAHRPCTVRRTRHSCYAAKLGRPLFPLIVQTQSQRVQPVTQRLQRLIPCPHVAQRLAAKPLLEAIDAPQPVLRQQVQVNRQRFHRRRRFVAARHARRYLADVVGDAPEIVTPRAARLGPADAGPLQGVIRHAVAFIIAACAPQVPGRVAAKTHDNRPDGAPLGLRQQKRAITRREQIERRCVIAGRMHAELIARAGRGHQAVERIQISRFGLAHRHPLTLCQADVIAPLAFHVPEDGVFVPLDVEENGAAAAHLPAGCKAVAAPSARDGSPPCPASPARS